MTVRRERPADLFGRRRGDRAIRLFSGVAETRLRWTALIHRRMPAGRIDDHRLTLTVAQRRVAAHDTDVVALRLVAPDGRALPAWWPGAHLDLELPSGRLRQYSLCGDPADRYAYRIAVRRIPDGGGGSIEMHDRLPVGARITVRGPRNAFPFVLPGLGSTSARIRFIAGGIGVTPILPMVRAARRSGADWSLIYTGRSRDTLPFLDEIAAFGDRVTVRTDDVSGLPDAAELLADAGPGTAVYCCGPAPMTAAVAAEVRRRPGIELHSERFSAPPVLAGEPFRVRLARTGEEFAVPADRTLLAEVLARRPDTPYSCRQGFCRTCRVRVLSGAADHRDTVLTPAERAAGDLLPCVSRCAGDLLELDL
ncbi:PDR/VanB family oxidoreductase [Nocardia aurantia]|uniref:Phenoxybenzoate dioxygenase subunit beta n=1 Tax=Nocardia aurantia TaxID=2585199 RepID=A0A7K0DLU4_9NOCA|nr:PDR/VanB family oxidoreductase [Nocardia aurantia]MQY26716.1 Phenoxybenzoate dioxygenase subunit beta [Nocardia aurantia]